MMAKRVETQVRWDWDLLPGLQSLCFASKVNLSVGISLRKGLQRLEAGVHEAPDTSIGEAMKRIKGFCIAGTTSKWGYPCGNILVLAAGKIAKNGRTTVFIVCLFADALVLLRAM